MRLAVVSDLPLGEFTEFSWLQAHVKQADVIIVTAKDPNVVNWVCGFAYACNKLIVLYADSITSHHTILKHSTTAIAKTETDLLEILGVLRDTDLSSPSKGYAEALAKLQAIYGG